MKKSEKSPPVGGIFVTIFAIIVILIVSIVIALIIAKQILVVAPFVALLMLIL